jgi:hypothetical protein
LNNTSLFSTRSANASLWCLFWTVSLGNTVILYVYKFKSLFNIRWTHHLDIPCCAAAFLIGSLRLLCSATLTTSMFSGERTNEGRWLFLATLKRYYQMVIKFMDCFEWRQTSHLKTDMKPPLCDHNTSCFNKEQHCFYTSFYTQSYFVSHLV